MRKARLAGLHPVDDAYNDASDFADLISGLLGKDDELVKKMRKFRK